MHRIAGTIVSCLLLAACGGAAEIDSVAGATAPAAAAAAPPATAYVAQICSRAKAPCPGARGFVELLDGETIVSGIDRPSSLAVDASHRVYVGNSRSEKAGTVGVYPAGGGAPIRTIEHIRGDPHWLEIDRSGSLFVVSNYTYKCCQIRGSVAVYGADATASPRRLGGTSSFPGPIAFDRSGNAYVANFDDYPGYVGMYAPGATTPSRVITGGIGFPHALAFDTVGNLYVLNGLFDGSYDVTVYAPGSSSVLRTIKQGLAVPSAIALDRGGSLFVANGGKAHGRSSVTVYSAGNRSVSRTIFDGIREPIALDFDATGRLYVANAPPDATNSIAVYAAGATAPLQTYSMPQEITAFALAR